MPTEMPIVRRIRTYAFTHNCDLDEATFRVLKEASSEVSMLNRKEGLYDRYFGGGEVNAERT